MVERTERDANALAILLRYDPARCWPWPRTVNADGYGIMALPCSCGEARRFVPAHRAVYELLVGPIPEGLTLDHLCRVRNCVNPDHLEPVTPRENTLRGTGPSAINATKTHCKHGHELTKGNVILEPRPNNRVSRKCRICHNLTARRSAERAAQKVPI